MLDALTRPALLADKVSKLIDVGSQFGACTAIAAKRFPHVPMLALELYPSNVEILRARQRYVHAEADFGIVVFPRFCDDSYENPLTHIVAFVFISLEVKQFGMYSLKQIR